MSTTISPRARQIELDVSDAEKKRALCAIMRKVHALAETAWPRDERGISEMPEAGLHAIMDIQAAACKALGLPEDLDLMTGEPVFDLT